MALSIEQTANALLSQRKAYQEYITLIKEQSAAIRKREEPPILRHREPGIVMWLNKAREEFIQQHAADIHDLAVKMLQDDLNGAQRSLEKLQND